MQLYRVISNVRLTESAFFYLRAKGLDIDRTLYLAIDEIQYLDNPSSFLKLFFDHYQGQVKLIVTGSSTFSIKSKFKDSSSAAFLNSIYIP